MVLKKGQSQIVEKVVSDRDSELLAVKRTPAEATDLSEVESLVERENPPFSWFAGADAIRPAAYRDRSVRFTKYSLPFGPTRGRYRGASSACDVVG